MIRYVKNILYILGEDKSKLPFLVILFLLSSLVEVLGVAVVGPYIALAFGPSMSDNELLLTIIQWLNLSVKHESFLTLLGLMLIIVFMMKMVLSTWVNYRIIYFTQNQNVILREKLMHTYQSMAYVDYIQRNSSDYINSIHSLVAGYSSNVLTGVLKFLSESIVVIAILLILLWTNWLVLFLLILLLIPVMLFYDYFFGFRLKGYGVVANQSNIAMVKNITQGIEGAKELRVLANQGFFLDKVVHNAKSLRDSESKRQLISMFPRFLLELLLIIFVVLVVVVMSEMGGGREYMLSTLGVFGVASMRLLPAISSLTGSVAMIRFGGDTVDRMYGDIKLSNSYDKNVSYDHAFQKYRNRDVFEKILLKNISFIYPNSKNKSLNNMSLRIMSGECIGFIGHSGAGKTTIVDLLLGLLQPTSGTIEYNGRRCESLASTWQKQVAYLPQQVFLIDASVRNNIALGVPDHEIDSNRIEESIKQASLGEVIKQLADGVNTEIGERGVRLSGGQRQRVALARAFYHKRRILVMDEATSALDSKTEQEIVNEINQLKGKMTMIVIAHRLSTLQHCDRVYKLEKGRIIDTGMIDSNLIFHSNGKKAYG